jgi:L-seryl-tRNA(Ser) seleniumtransferase
LQAGASLVSFSGDKLLGGPQAGIVAGDEKLVVRLRRNPMFRALRLDKLIYQALEITLRSLLLERWDFVPALAMIRASSEDLRTRAGSFVSRLKGIHGRVIKGQSMMSSRPSGACGPRTRRWWLGSRTGNCCLI